MAGLGLVKDVLERIFRVKGDSGKCGGNGGYAYRDIPVSTAEYCGMTKTAKQLQWIHNLYEELEFKLGPLPLCIDNQGAIFLASNPAQEGRMKHVRMTEHFI